MHVELIFAPPTIPPSTESYYLPCQGGATMFGHYYCQVLLTSCTLLYPWHMKYVEGYIVFVFPSVRPDTCYHFALKFCVKFSFFFLLILLTADT